MDWRILAAAAAPAGAIDGADADRNSLGDMDRRPEAAAAAAVVGASGWCKWSRLFGAGTALFFLGVGTGCNAPL